MTESITTGELIARFLESCDVTTVFGVISIHNMPILDAIARRGKIRFVPARSEQGAANMADAHARVSGRRAPHRGEAEIAPRLKKTGRNQPHRRITRQQSRPAISPMPCQPKGVAKAAAAVATAAR